jgi:hypothetical protein
MAELADLADAPLQIFMMMPENRRCARQQQENDCGQRSEAGDAGPSQRHGKEYRSGLGGASSYSVLQCDSTELETSSLFGLRGLTWLRDAI